MADRGWVRLGDCEPGTLVEPVAFQTQWLFTGFVLQPDDGTPPTYELHGVGADEVMYQSPDLAVYPLTAVRLHPSLAGSDLWGLVRAWAAEPGDVTAGVLLDAMAEHAGRDPDVAAAVRERCAGVANEYAASASSSRDSESYGSPSWMFDDGRGRGAVDVANTIRALGRPAATGDCFVCGGTKVIDSGGVTPWGEPVNTECPNCTTPPAATAAACGRCGGNGWLYWNVVGAESGRDPCPACGGTGGATGEGV